MAKLNLTTLKIREEIHIINALSFSFFLGFFFFFLLLNNQIINTLTLRKTTWLQGLTENKDTALKEDAEL